MPIKIGKIPFPLEQGLCESIHNVRTTSHTSQELWPWVSKLKAVPIHVQNCVVWSRTLKCGVKSYATLPSTNCYINTFLSMRILTHDQITYINGSEHLECHGLLILCWTYLQEVVFECSPSDHETWSIRCHVGIHVDFTSILHSHTPLVAKRSVKQRTWTSLLCEFALSRGGCDQFRELKPKIGEIFGIITGRDPSVCKSNR